MRRTQPGLLSLENSFKPNIISILCDVLTRLLILTKGRENGKCRHLLTGREIRHPGG